MRSAMLAISIAVATSGAAHATGNSVAPIRLPFHVKQGLILMDGRVDSTSGVFLLDTEETYFRFLLNRNYVPLESGADLYKVHAASGQSSMIQIHRGQHRIMLAGKLATTAQSGAKRYPKQVLSDDFAQMQENVDSRLLGAVGFAFLRHYDFTIDYQEHIISLYPLGSAPRFMTGITIKFVPKSPIVPFTLDVGRTHIPATIDTGGWERLKAPPEIWDSLASGGHVAELAGETGCVSILRTRYGPHEFDIPYVEKITAQETMLTLGYPFLRGYLSVWKPVQGTVTLVPKNNVRRLPPSSCD